MAKDNKGFVKIPRGLLEDLASERHKYCKIEAFLYLANKARFADSDDVSTRVTCKKGQIVTSLRELSNAFQWPEAAVRRFLYSLVEKDFIIWTSYKRTTVITMKFLAEKGIIEAEEKRGDATCDAKSDATCDATCDAIKEQEIKGLDNVNDATCDATCDAKSDATCDAFARVLYSDLIVRRKEEGKKNNSSSRKGGLSGKKTLVGNARVVFEEFYAKKGVSDESYYWTAKDATNMQLLLQKIRHAREGRKMTTDDESLLDALRKLLESISDKWLLEHLEVANINSKYNEIVANAKNMTKQEKTIFPPNPRHGDRIGYDWFYDMNEGRWIKDGEKNRRGEIFNVQAGRWLI